MTIRTEFSADALALFLHAKCRHPVTLTVTEAADAAGVSRAQFFRAMHRQPVNINAFLSLCRWIGTNPFCFVTDVETGRCLSPLPDASHETSGETRGYPERAVA